MKPLESSDRILGDGDVDDGDSSCYAVNSLTCGLRRGDTTTQAGTAARAGALLLLATSSAFLFGHWVAQPRVLVYPGEPLPIEDEAVRHSCAADHAGYPQTPLAHAAVVAALSVAGTQAIALWVLSPNDRAGERRDDMAHEDGTRVGGRRGAALAIWTTLLGITHHAIGICQCIPVAYVPQGECGIFIDPTTVAPAAANFVNLLLAAQLLSASSQGISRGARACALLVVAADWCGSLAGTMRSDRRAIPALVAIVVATALLVAAATRFNRLRAEVARLSRMCPRVADAIIDEAPALLVARNPFTVAAARCRGIWRTHPAAVPRGSIAACRDTAASPGDGEELAPLAAAVAAGRLAVRDALQLQTVLARAHLKAAGTLALTVLGAVLLMDGALFGGVLLHSPDSTAHETGWIATFVARDVLRFSMLPTVVAILLARVRAKYNTTCHALARKLEQEQHRDEEQLMLRYGA